ncbi:MAG: 23S rRNA (guanosine(2251)-2'-O)-methyltransferase RlmB [Sinomicrobium sp.]|nr:23S rRNA (guanosine(2251)-2'-O)-methyltransferase RlmB [Sinomicrobium sp.]
MQNNYQIYGIRAVIEAIRSGRAVDKIFVQKGLRGDLFAELNALVRKENIPCAFVPAEKLNRLGGKNHQGVAACISPVAFHNFEDLLPRVVESGKIPLFLMLDQLSDVRNFGAIIRTAACTGVDGIIIPKSGAAPVTADTVKTSAGAVFKVPICKVNHLKDAVYYLQASGIKTVAATEKATTTVYDIALTMPVAVIMGAEDKGITPSLLRIADEKARLPMYGDTGSLNVSVACGVFLYEALRQRSL